MVRKVKAFLVTLCLLFAAEATAISGNEWKQLSQTARVYYVMGVLDGWDNLGNLISRTNPNQQLSVVTNHAKLVNCVAGMTHSQIAAIVQKYMENNPARWHSAMTLLVWLALYEVCESTSK